MPNTFKIAVIGGDGTGPEVTGEACKVLESAALLEDFQYETVHFDYGANRYLKTGEVITEKQIDEFRQFDAIFLGAVGHPEVPPGILEKNLLLAIRFQLDQYINLRPVKLYPGVSCPLQDKQPEDICFDVVRENTEDLYCGAGGFMRKNTAHEVATQEMITTRFGVERCLRWAFEHCRRRKDRKQLTLVHKTNVLTYSGDLWYRAFEEIGTVDYPDIKRDYNHIDAACMWFVKNPEYYDTLVVPNMFGDILTDLGAIIQGGLGVAAGGNVSPDPGGCSMFEPMGGSAPKYSGQNVINPIAAIAAMAMLLCVVGEQKDTPNLVRAGNRIEVAITRTTTKMKSMSAGHMGYTTNQVGDLVAEAL